MDDNPTYLIANFITIDCIFFKHKLDVFTSKMVYRGIKSDFIDLLNRQEYPCEIKPIFEVVY